MPKTTPPNTSERISAELFPWVMDFKGKSVLVVGAGKTAKAKIAQLLKTGASITAVAPDAEALLEEFPSPAPGSLQIKARPYQKDDLQNVWFVVSAAGDSALNAEIARDSAEKQVWLNAADDPSNCSAIMPAKFSRGPLMVAISTSGVSPAMASFMRRQLEQLIGTEYEILLDMLADIREELISKGVSTESLNWQKALDSKVLEYIKEEKPKEAKEHIYSCLL